MPQGTTRQPVLHPPKEVLWLMAALESAGHRAYVVGGCVRDALLGRQPNDWDLCTDALPPQMEALFAGQKLILTGEKHGTVAVVLGHKSYEITTFRVESGYADNRHPDRVRFVPQLRQDLARRDFTVNAMAWSPREGLVDVFGGRQDLAAGCIQCVGDARERFGEDALRILRAVRFAAQLDFFLADKTVEAARTLAATMRTVSAERLFAELDKLLAGRAAGRVLAEYGAVLAGAVPEIAPCMGCTQPGRWHCYDVWNHTAAAVAALPNQPGNTPEQSRIVRWAVLLHDIAKPPCRTVDADGAAHFPGHNQRGAEMAQNILTALRAPRVLTETAAKLISMHDAALPQTRADILRMMYAYRPDFLQMLCTLKRADLAAHAQQPALEERVGQVRNFSAQMEELQHSPDACWKLSSLAVNGADLTAVGLPAGPLLGQTLNRLLFAVMDGTLPNDRAALLADALKQQAVQGKMEHEKE